MSKANSKIVNGIILALLITDTHLHKNNVELVKDIFRQAIKLCLEHGLKKIYHLGDFFTSREAQPLHVLIEAKEIFLMIKEAGLEMDIIPGNHDKVDLNSTLSYLHAVEKNDAIRLIDNVFDWMLSKEVNVLYLPYFKEKESYLPKLKEATDLIRKDKINILLTHISINGVTNNDGSAVENEIKQELFKKFDYVYVGHYHNKQSNGNIHYIGSSYQANFGEDEIKGFQFLMDNGKVAMILSKFPKYIKEKINIDDKDKLKKFEKQYANSTDNVRFILTGEKTKLQAFKKENLLDKGIDVKFENDEINTNVDIANNEIVVFDRSNIKSAFDKFTEINSIEDKEFGESYLEQIL